MKADQDLQYLSATELVSALAQRDISALELLDQTISRIEALDPTINAMPVRDFEQARASAKAADARIGRGERLPLLGLPISVKESYNVAGLPTTWGNVQFKDWCPEEDAVAVKRLKAAGAIIIGKTNVPLMLRDWQSYNDIYGITNNPWNIKHTPGGSSGGSAAALAAGFVSLELGSDLAGSLRVPAHFCGVYTHKPSQELIPLRGAGIPKLPSYPHRVDLAAGGPMARTARDLLLGLDILAGPDELVDGKGYKLALPPARHNKLKDFRVLVMDTHPLFPTSTHVTKALSAWVERLEKLGVSITHFKNLSELETIARMYAMFWPAIVSARMPVEEHNRIKALVNKLPADDPSILTCKLRGSTCSHRDWLIASSEREKLRHQWRHVFSDFDIILCPVMPTTAFAHDHTEFLKRQIEVDGQHLPYGDQFIWSSLATLFGLPATVMPITVAENGLPVGVQIIGDYLEDYTALKFAELAEREFGTLKYNLGLD